MKKTLLVLMLMFGFILMACGNDANDADTNPPNVEEATTETEANLEDESEEEERSQSDNLSLQSMIETFIAEGFDIDVDEKPLYQMIGASDGVRFWADGEQIMLYEYADEDALVVGVELYNEMREGLIETLGEENVSPPLVVNGLLALETDNEQVIEIFNNID